MLKNQCTTTSVASSPEGDLKTFFDDFEAWCAANNISPSTACNRALGDTYRLARMRKRQERTAQDVEKLRDWMAAFEAEAEASTKGAA